MQIATQVLVWLALKPVPASALVIALSPFAKTVAGHFYE